MHKTVFITGATGLLGAQVAHDFARKGYNVIKSATRSHADIIGIALDKEEQLGKVIDYQWDTMIHCAAIKDPDVCENNTSFSHKVNVQASIALAEISKKLNRRFIFISTDYVFDGNNPPYSEDDLPNPLNVYGKQKYEAEQAILAVNPNAIILRIPYLYGELPSIQKCPMLMQSLNMINHPEKSFILNGEAIRYPTWTSDVAHALEFLVRLFDASGIYHYSAQEPFNRIEIHEAILFILGTSTPNVEYVFKSNPLSNATRPIDAHLEMKRLQLAGFLIPNRSFVSQLEFILNHCQKDVKI